MIESFFEFTNYHFIDTENKALFSYRLGAPDGEIYSFTETLTFPSLPTTPVNSDLLDRALRAVHMALGISYYKLYCPTKLILKTSSLSKTEADFWKIIYTESEIMQLYYGFNVDFREKGNFPFDQEVDDKPVGKNFADRALVLFGGGKDSLVSYDLIKNSGEDTMFFDFGRFDLHDVISEKLGVARLVIEREIDPQLFKLNSLPGVYSGRKAHVPIPTMIAFVAVLSAILYDYQYIVFSNEESAEYGNTTYLGQEVNHQWSKSRRAEKLIQNFITTSITPDLSCFSLLRPYHEIEIVRKFSQMPEYWGMFSSCNQNFKLRPDIKTPKLWCCACEKCAFVWTLLSAFISKKELLHIFGENIFEREQLMQTYKDLLGIGTMKPFECVGTPEETIVAFYLAHQRKEYETTPIMQMFLRDVLPHVESIDVIQKKVFSFGDDSLIPDRFKKLLS